MKGLKFKDLVKGDLYQNAEGYYVFVEMRNSYLATFNEVEFDENEESVIVDTIYKTEKELKFE